MNDVLLAKAATAGSAFMLWHLLALTLCATGLLLEKVIRRGNSHLRSTLLRLALVVSLALPLLGSIGKVLPAAPPVAAPSVQEKTAFTSNRRPLADLVAIDWNRAAVWRPLIADVGQAQEQAAARLGLPSLQILEAGLLGVSSLVSFYLFCRFEWAVFLSFGLARSGRSLAAAEEAACRKIASALRAPVPRLRKVEGLKSPVLLGLFRPVILLPDRVRARDEIYGHELTHLKRHDLWWHLLARVATIFMPLQPGFWLLKDSLARADEDVCDDMVLAQGADRSAYAELLVQVAEFQHTPSPELCLSMAAFRSKLEHRVHRLMDTARPLTGRLSIFSLGLWLSPLLVVAVLAGAIDLDAERPLQAIEEKPAKAVTAGQAKSQGIAALVNQHPILTVTVDQNFAVTETQLKQNLSGDELNEAIAKARNGVIHALIDRELILEEFKSSGGFIPDEFVNARVDDDVKNLHGGDRKAFLAALTERHVTLEMFKQEIQDNAIVQYMRSKNVAEKLRTYYEAHLDLFPQDEQVNVSLILIPRSPDSPTYAIAQQVLDQAKKGVDFTALAKEYNLSTDRGVDRKMSLWVTEDAPASFPEAGTAGWKAIEKLQPGQTSDIFEGDSFYAIARVNERRPARIAATDEAIAQKNGLIDAETKLLTEEWLGPLRAAAQIQNFEFPRPGHISRNE